MNPTILGVIGPGFLNQVPTLLRYSIVLGDSLGLGLDTGAGTEYLEVVLLEISLVNVDMLHKAAKTLSSPFRPLYTG